MPNKVCLVMHIAQPQLRARIVEKTWPDSKFDGREVPDDVPVISLQQDTHNCGTASEDVERNEQARDFGVYLSTDLCKDRGILWRVTQLRIGHSQVSPANKMELVSSKCVVIDLVA